MSLYLTLIILFLVVAIILRVDFVFYIAYVAIGIWVWSRFVIPWQLRRVEITRHYPRRVFWNERFPVQVVVHNRGWLGLSWLQIKESIALELRIGETLNEVLALRGREKLTLEQELMGKKRGRYAIGPLVASTSDLFGLGALQISTIEAEDVIVYPRIHTLNSLGLPSKLPFGTLPANERLFADPSRSAGVREYRSGDSLRTMNWKVSAHTEKLMVRTYQPAVAQEVLIVLNLYTPDFMRKDRYAYIEWGIELAASLAAYLLQQKQGVVLAPQPELSEGGTVTLQSPPGYGKHEAGAMPGRRVGAEFILEELAQIQPQEDVPLEDWLPRACRDVQWGTTILVITPTASAQITAILHQLVRSGRNPVLIISQPLSDQQLRSLQQRGRRLGFSTYYVPRVHDLAVWQTAQKKAAA